MIRLGDKSMSDIKNLTDKFNGKLIDYANSDITSDILDCYLLSECEFYIGTNSGPSYVPQLFNKNMCWTNYYPVANSLAFSPNDVSIFKKLVSAEENSLIPLELLFRKPLSNPLQIDELSLMNIKLINNTPSEILNAVKDFMLIQQENNEEFILNRYVRQYINNNNDSFGTLAKFSESFLENYIAESDVEIKKTLLKRLEILVLMKHLSSHLKIAVQSLHLKIL